MSHFKKILSIWIVANILFIPGFKSLDLVQNSTQHICLINVNNSLNNDSNGFNSDYLKSHCDKCDFFHEFDTSYIIISEFNFINKDITNLITITNYLYNKKNNLQLSTRAPPNII